MNASNRQKKVMAFFHIPFTENTSFGAANWEIGIMMMDEKNRDLWRRYLYLTRDFEIDSPTLKEFDHRELESVEIPEGWDDSIEARQFRHEIAEAELSDGSPFDRPQPDVDFSGKTFLFTGRFEFGSRKVCRAAVEERGGNFLDDVSSEVDFLVVGNKGSSDWKWGKYGNKIEAAVLMRREHGSPAIISEDHWVAALS